MPLHLGSHTKVHLVTADIRKTTTDQPSNKKAPQFSRHVEKVEQMFKDGRILKESHIPLAGDSNRMHFLGSGEDYMPFMMVRAGEDLRQVPTTKEEKFFHTDPVRNAIYAKILGNNTGTAIKSPQALALRVELSKKSFLKTNKPAEDIRIDVFFNGQLTHSTMWSKRLYSDDKKQDQLLSVFSGLRTHWMCERAWTIVPPGQDPNGSRRRPVANVETLEDRWDNIQRELLKEVAARGVDKKGNRSAVAKYLVELSKLAVPPELKDWSEPRGQMFGVIDVVLSYGQGSKDTPAKVYITEPTRMRSSKFKEREDAPIISEDLPRLQDTITGRYALRNMIPDISTANQQPVSVSRIPSRYRPGKTYSGSLETGNSERGSGPLVEETGRVISSSEQLPQHLADKLTREGYKLQIHPARGYSESVTKTHGRGFTNETPQTPQPHQFRQESSLPSEASGGSVRPLVIDLDNSPPAAGSQFTQPHRSSNREYVASPRPINRRSAAPRVAQLQEIPEEEEGIPTSSFGNVFTSPLVARSVPMDGSVSFSSAPAESSQDFQELRPQIASEDSLAGLPSPRDSLLPPLQIHTGVRARRMSVQDGEGSPRKKRRLSGSRTLNITVPEGFGVNQRGGFVALGSPNDKSTQRSRFNSFTLSPNVHPDQVWSSNKPPPESPITPDQNSPRKQDPLVNRLVIKRKEQALSTFDFSVPFRRSEVAAVARSARDRSEPTKQAWDWMQALNTPTTPKMQSAHILASLNSPSTPKQPPPLSSAQAPRTPIAVRTRNRSQSIDGRIPNTGGIYNTPDPLPRYPQQPPPSTPRSQSRRRQRHAAPTTPVDQMIPPLLEPSSPAPHHQSQQQQQQQRRIISSAATTRASTPASSSIIGASGPRPRNLRQDDPAHPFAQMERAFRAFETPPLARDCAITYAQPGSEALAKEQWVMEEGPRAFGGGVVRQVRSERMGTFEEDGVLVGVRFVVV